MADVSYLKDMPIAVLGGGAVGKTMAADCALAGKEVRIWDQPAFAKRNFLNIEKTGITLSGNQFSFFGYQRKGIAKVALATDDMAKAVKGAGIIIVATVALAHENLFRELIPLLEDGQIIHILPDNCGTLIFRKLMREMGCTKDVVVGAWYTAPYGIRVVRRGTGGGAVYHDLGNLNYSFITDAGEKEKLSFARFTEPVVKALCELGLSASASGRNDILVDGCKVSGTAQRLSGDRVLHHGTLLFDSDPSLVAGALTVHPEKFQSKSAKSVRARIGNIRSFLREDMTLPIFWEYLRTALAQGAFQETTLMEEELREVQRLRDEKYATWDWNYGKSPAYDMVNHRRFAGGTLEVHMNVRSGVIREIAFSGDFLSRRELAPVTEALCGCAVEPESVDRVLHQFPLEEYFGTITAEEVRDTVCNRGGVE